MRNLGPFDLQNCMLKGIAGIEAGSRSRQDTAPSKLRFSSLNLGPLCWLRPDGLTFPIGALPGGSHVWAGSLHAVRPRSIFSLPAGIRMSGEIQVGAESCNTSGH